MEEKTNVMRALDKGKVCYQAHTYGDTGAVSGLEVARVLKENPDTVFKTLVTVGKSSAHYVFMVPVSKELDLKKAAKSVGEKMVDMVDSRELLPLTGYIHGGCSPIGMKKQLRTVIDSSAEQHDRIFFSAGKIGYQIETTLKELNKALQFELHDVSE